MNHRKRNIEQRFDPTIECIMDAASDGMWIEDSAGRCLRVNDAALAVFETTADKFLSQDSSAKRWAMINEGAPGLIPPTTHAIRTGIAQFCLMAEVQVQGGAMKLATIKVVPLPDSKLLITIRETSDEETLTRRLEAERKRLAEREGFLNATLNELHCLVSYVDSDGVYRYVNSTYERWTGRAKKDFIGKTVRELIGESNWKNCREQLEGALNGEVRRYENNFVLGGVDRTLQVTYVPDFESPEKVRGLYCISYDISEVIQARSAVAMKDKENTRLLNALPSLIAHFDRKLVSVNCNAAYAAFFGTTPESIKGRTYAEILGPKMIEMNMPYIEAVLAGSPQQFERGFPLPNGEVRYMRASFSPDISAGEVVGFFVEVRDFTIERRLEDDRTAIEAKLIASSKMSLLGEMAGGAAHEINNPLAIISAYSARVGERLEKLGIADDRILSDIAKIEKTAYRIARIVRGLRAFARDAEKDPKETAEVATIVADTLDLCRERLQQRGIEIRFTGAKNELLHCRATQVSQILMNLIGNSTDAVVGLNEKWIEIRVERSGDQIDLDVIDSGHGIPLDVAERIMNPFFTTKPVGSGTGLGLSISKGLAEENGGSLRYLAEAARTTFRLSLPAGHIREVSV